MGAQRRSSAAMRQIIPEIHNGLIGKPILARVGMSTIVPPIGHGKPAPVPEWLDYKLWQGPAPRRDYIDNLIHYNWALALALWHGRGIETTAPMNGCLPLGFRRELADPGQFPMVDATLFKTIGKHRITQTIPGIFLKARP